jgi:hypothetical protein
MTKDVEYFGERKWKLKQRVKSTLAETAKDGKRQTSLSRIIIQHLIDFTVVPLQKWTILLWSLWGVNAKNNFSSYLFFSRKAKKYSNVFSYFFSMSISILLHEIESER